MSSSLRLTRLIVKPTKISVNGNGKGHLLNNTKILGIFNQIQSAGLVSVENQDESFKRFPPFDYKNKSYTKIHRHFNFLDPTSIRMNDNSKIITVEGNIGSEKGTFAREIAKRFGMLYMPEPKLEDLYINYRGFDYRTLNKYIHEKLHAIDEKMYYENPKHLAVPWMKYYFYRLRYVQYMDALAHLFNTGQGVVLERYPGSDFVFTEAMYKTGILSKDVYDYYYRLRYNTIHELLRPHLIIYLDCDVDTALKRIKARNIPHEVNSSVLTREYLQEIEKAYKDKYLPDVALYSHVEILDWNKPESYEDIVEAIEKIDLEDNPIDVKKFRDWYIYKNSLWNGHRYTYTNLKLKFIKQFEQTKYYDVDEMFQDENDKIHRDEVYESFVPEYGLVPQFANKSVIAQLFTKETFYKSLDFHTRFPFY